MSQEDELFEQATKRVFDGIRSSAERLSKESPEVIAAVLKQMGSVYRHPELLKQEGRK